MSEHEPITDDLGSGGEPAESAAAGATETVPPKTLPWPWTIALLMLLPAVAAVLWFGGTRHRIDDHPPKVSKKPVGWRGSMRARPMARPAAMKTDPMAPADSRPGMAAPGMVPTLKDPFSKGAAPKAGTMSTKLVNPFAMRPAVKAKPGAPKDPYRKRPVARPSTMGSGVKDPFAMRPAPRKGARP